MQLNKIKRLRLLIIALMLVAAAAGCGRKPQQQPAAVQNAAPLQHLSGSLKLIGAAATVPVSEDLAAAFTEMYPDVKINVVGGTTLTGIRAVSVGSADIGLASRNLASSEQSTVDGTKIGFEGVAAIVHPSNGVNALTLDQVRQIFSGQITDWKDVGGPDAHIDLFTREEGSSARSIIQDTVMDNTQINPGAGIQTSIEAIRGAVAQDPDAIGYVSLGDLDQTVKALAIQGVQPNQQTVDEGVYKISHPLLFLTKGEPTGLVKDFIDWVLSPEGQAIVGQHYVKVNY